MKKYTAYKFTLCQLVGGSCVMHWRIQDPSTGYYHYHRVGGPAYVRYNADGSVFVQTWDLNGEEYHAGDWYQKALEKWLE